MIKIRASCTCRLTPDRLAVAWSPAPSMLPTRMVAAVAMPKGSANVRELAQAQHHIVCIHLRGACRTHSSVIFQTLPPAQGPHRSQC